VTPLTNGQYGLIGGHHRWEAAKLLKLSAIAARVQQVHDTGEARLAAIEDNVKNGLPVSRQAKLELAERLKMAYPDMSNRQIAKRAGISEGTVRRMLARLDTEETEKEMQERYSVASEVPAARKLLKLAYQFLDENKAGGVLGIGASVSHADAQEKRVKALVQEARKSDDTGKAITSFHLLSVTFAEAAKRLESTAKAVKPAQNEPAKKVSVRA
jgi:ParB-like chromosome segregation protein Spo0J